MNQTNEELEISLLDILRSMWDFRWIVIILTLLGGFAGAALSAGGLPSYETKASMLVTAMNSEGNYRNGTSTPQPEDIYLSQNLTKTVQLLSTSNRVLQQVLAPEEFSGITPENLKNRIQVTAETGTSFLWLSLVWEDDSQAVAILNRLMEVLPEVMLEVMDIGSVNIIDMAQNAVVVQSSTPRTGAIGAALGLTAGCGAGILYYLFKPKVRGTDSLEQLNLDVISDIPQITKGSARYLDEGTPSLAYREAYGRLAAVFRYLTEQKNVHIIGITSSSSGEGKSTVAYNLSLRLTEIGSKVLLLDFDFKKGSLYELLKTRKPKDGDVRSKKRDGEHLDELVEQMYSGIYTIQGFSEKDIFQIDNKIFPALREMKEQFDYILIDTPPVGTLSDVQQMRGLMEGVLLVTRQDAASLNAVTQSVTFLEHTGIPVIGCILNGKKY